MTLRSISSVASADTLHAMASSSQDEPVVVGSLPEVAFIQRKPYPTGHFSLEFIFADVRNRLAKKIQPRIVEGRWFSRGVFRRLWIALEASLRQGDVNLITGDIQYVALFLKKRRTLLMIPDCGQLQASGGAMRTLEKLMWLTLPIRRARKVITISENAREEILQLTGCDPEKVVVIPVAINEQFVYSPRDFHQECPVLLQVGQAENKNLTRILEAIRGLPVKLVVIGEISARNRDLINSYGINCENRCRLRQEQIVQAYVDCDMLVFPSTYEGFGMPIVEAQVVGRPVVTSNVASMPWVAGDGACLVDPFSVESIRAGILKVIEDKAYREELIVKGRENAKRFDPDEIAHRYLALIQETYAEV